MKGKIIAFEGIDGSGKNTQAKLLYAFLSNNGFSCKLMHFPYYSETFFGKEVGEYLNGGYGTLENVNPKLASILYAGDRFEKRDILMEELQKGRIVIIDRYVPSNIAHQSAKIPKEERQEFSKWIETLEYSVFKLPKEDMVIFLDIPPMLSSQLVLKKEQRIYTKKKQDLHEENQDYLNETYEEYKKLSKKANWIKINCKSNNAVKDPNEIAHEIIEKIKSKLQLKEVS